MHYEQPDTFLWGTWRRQRPTPPWNSPQHTVLSSSQGSVLMVLSPLRAVACKEDCQKAVCCLENKKNEIK